MRVDAGILPRFPHDANPDDAPVETLRALDDVEVIDDEFYGDLRSKDIGDDMDVADPSSWYLTQEEEYGRRLLADERRLAYVALTRAKKDALLTYSQYSILDRDPSQYLNRPGKRPSASKPSVFWTEMQDSLCHESGLVSACKSGSAGYSENADAIADSSPDLAVAGAASGASAHRRWTSWVWTGRRGSSSATTPPNMSGMSSKRRGTPHWRNANRPATRHGRPSCPRKPCRSSPAGCPAIPGL